MRALKKLQFTNSDGNLTANIELNRLSNLESGREINEKEYLELGREMTDEENIEAGRKMAEADTNVLDFSLIAKETLLKMIEIKKEKLKEPKTFKEAYFHEDPLQKNWRKVIKKELHHVN